MEPSLKDKRVAILVTDGFEEVELMEPRKALETAGAKTFVVSPEKVRVKAWIHDRPSGREVKVDVPLEEASASDFDALVLPGGVQNPDALRMNNAAVEFVKDFALSEKPIAAICHGPWILIDAGVAFGKTMTSWRSLKTDLANAGATWVDREVVVEKGLITSRQPKDIPAFNAAMIEYFADAAALKSAVNA